MTSSRRSTTTTEPPARVRRRRRARASRHGFGVAARYPAGSSAAAVRASHRGLGHRVAGSGSCVASRASRIAGSGHRGLGHRIAGSVSRLGLGHRIADSGIASRTRASHRGLGHRIADSGIASRTRASHRASASHRGLGHRIADSGIASRTRASHRGLGHRIAGSDIAIADSGIASRTRALHRGLGPSHRGLGHRGAWNIWAGEGADGRRVPATRVLPGDMLAAPSVPKTGVVSPTLHRATEVDGASARDPWVLPLLPPLVGPNPGRHRLRPAHGHAGAVEHPAHPRLERPEQKARGPSSTAPTIT
jgi:hypothetical protein